jgi:NADH-quinone oxidoreductase subunit M
VVGILLLGPIKNDHFLHLDDAKWHEKISTITLVLAIAAIGIAPLWLSDMINVSLGPIVDKISLAGADFTAIF